MPLPDSWGVTGSHYAPTLARWRASACDGPARRCATSRAPGLDWVRLAAAVSDGVARVVPFDRNCWHTVDPGTVLFTGHSGAARHVALERPAVRPGGLGRLRLLRLPLPLLLGPAAVPGVYTDGHADHVGSGQPEDRRAQGQLDLEQHGVRTFRGAIRVAQRVLALTAALWHNNKIGAPVARSLIAFDH